MILHNIPPVQAPDVKYFFHLASHGIRTPLTKIRWACSRIQKLEKKSEEELMLYKEIEKSTQQLNRILHSIFLLSRLQSKLENVSLKEKRSLFKLLSNAVAQGDWKERVKVTCNKDIDIETDADIFVLLLQHVFEGVTELIKDQNIVLVCATSEADNVTITWSGIMNIGFLREFDPKKSTWRSSKEIPGGTPGLEFALAKAFCEELGAVFSFQENPNQHYSISIRFPKKS